MQRASGQPLAASLPAYTIEVELCCLCASPSSRPADTRHAARLPAAGGSGGERQFLRVEKSLREGAVAAFAPLVRVRARAECPVPRGESWRG
eukprot:scaffold15840_cov105-Isochrysis_galbana.AAC.2